MWCARLQHGGDRPTGGIAQEAARLRTLPRDHDGDGQGEALLHHLLPHEQGLELRVHVLQLRAGAPGL
jgi:hypothetical protein